MNTRTASILIGIVFIVVGILGFFDNPVVGASEGAIFHADSFHNTVHLVSGALFLLIALASPARAGLFLKIFGLVYLLLGIIGLTRIGDEGMTEIFGILHVNGADNYLHIGLGVLILLAGFLPAYRLDTNDRTTYRA